MQHWKIAVLVVLAVGLIATAGYLGFKSSLPKREVETPKTVAVSRGDVRQAVSAPGQLVGMRQEKLRMGVEGRLASVNIRAGDSVKKGTLLASLSGREKFAAAETASRLEALKAQKELEELIANAPKVTADAQVALIEAEKKYDEAKKYRESLDYPRGSPERIQTAQDDYDLAQEMLDKAEEEYEPVKYKTFDDPERVMAYNMLQSARAQRDEALRSLQWFTGKPDKFEVAKRDAELAQAKAAYEKAKREWDKVKDGIDQTELDIAKAKVADLEAKHQEAKVALEHVDLRAPYDGVVLEVKVVPGDQVDAESVVAVLSAPKALEALVTVVEEDYGVIRVGQSVEVFADAQPGAEITGKVSRIVAQRIEGDRPLYPVYITLNKLPDDLAAGMSIDTSIAIESRQNVLMLPKALVRARSDGSAQVEVWDGANRVKREIKIGLIGDQNVEILEGLAEGELVVAQ